MMDMLWEALTVIPHISQVKTYLYDICGNPECPCPAVYRLEYRDALQCPVCMETRYDIRGKPRRQLRYMPLSDYLRDLLSNVDMVK